MDFGVYGNPQRGPWGLRLMIRLRSQKLMIHVNNFIIAISPFTLFVFIITSILNTLLIRTTHLTQFLGATRSIARLSYGNVAGWLGGWLAGCLSHPVLYQNDKTYLKTFSTIS